MVRRIIYAALIVFMPHLPQVATIALISMCVAMLAFSLHEKQWKDAAIQNLAVANEAFFYLLLVLILTCSVLTNSHSVESNYLGWSMIAVVTLAVFVNLTVISANACNHCKLLYIRHKNKQAYMAKKGNQVTPSYVIDMVAIEKPKQPVPAPIQDAIEEVSSVDEESLGILGLPQPELINPVVIDLPKPEAPPQLLRPTEEVDVQNPEDEIKEKSVNLSKLAKDICEESPQEKSSEDGDHKSVDLEEEMEKIEKSINKSVRSETQSTPDNAAMQGVKDSQSDNDESSAKQAADIFRREVEVDTRHEAVLEVTATNKTMARMNESSFQYVQTMTNIKEESHWQVNKPMLDEDSDIIGEEDSQLSNSMDKTVRMDEQETPAQAITSRQDAIMEQPRRGQKNKLPSVE